MPPNVNHLVTEPALFADLRKAAGLTQREVAERLEVTSGMVSRWERGTHPPRGRNLHAIARMFGVHPKMIAFPVRSKATARATMEDLLMADAPTAVIDARVTQSQDQWCHTRQALNANRTRLAELAADIYPADHRLGGTTMLTTPAWLPDRPVDLNSIRLIFDGNAAPAAVDGTGAATSHLRPLAELVRPYARYTAAVRDLAHPVLFENRYTWRPLAIGWAPNGGHLTYGDTTYFATTDVHEAVAHETALAAIDEQGGFAHHPTLRDLPFRRHIGDPFDLHRRALISSISTLTIRSGSQPTFLLHRRDSKSVAIAGGMLHVIPSGIFQPSSVLPAAKGADFDWWRNIQREISEELLGNPEHNGDGEPVDYATEPFATLDAARNAGRLKVTCVGLGLDALTLACETLTVAVFDPDLFDDLADDFVAINDEGSVVSERVPFDEACIAYLLGSGRMAPAAAGLLHLAWQHRKALLG